MTALQLAEEQLFKQAMQISSPSERASFLQQACPDDEALREREAPEEISDLSGVTEPPRTRYPPPSSVASMLKLRKAKPSTPEKIPDSLTASSSRKERP